MHHDGIWTGFSSSECCSGTYEYIITGPPESTETVASIEGCTSSGSNPPQVNFTETNALGTGATHAASLADAQTKSTDELGARWADLRSGKWSGTRFIDLTPSLGIDFMHLKNSQAMDPSPTLRSVVRQGNQWVATLDGPNHDAAEVTLDDSFNVVRAAPLQGN